MKMVDSYSGLEMKKGGQKIQNDTQNDTQKTKNETLCS